MLEVGTFYLTSPLPSYYEGSRYVLIQVTNPNASRESMLTNLPSQHQKISRPRDPCFSTCTTSILRHPTPHLVSTLAHRTYSAWPSFISCFARLLALTCLPPSLQKRRKHCDSSDCATPLLRTLFADRCETIHLYHAGHLCSALVSDATRMLPRGRLLRHRRRRLTKSYSHCLRSDVPWPGDAPA